MSADRFPAGGQRDGQGLLLKLKGKNAEQKFKVRRVLYLKWTRWDRGWSGLYKRIFQACHSSVLGCVSFFHWAHYRQYGLDKKNGFRAHPWLCRAGVIKRLREGQVEGSSESDKWGERCPVRDGMGDKGRAGDSKLGGMDRAGRKDGHDQRPEQWSLRCHNWGSSGWWQGPRRAWEWLAGGRVLQNA